MEQGAIHLADGTRLPATDIRMTIANDLTRAMGVPPAALRSTISGTMTGVVDSVEACNRAIKRLVEASVWRAFSRLAEAILTEALIARPRRPQLNAHQRKQLNRLRRWASARAAAEVVEALAGESEACVAGVIDRCYREPA